MCKKNSIYIVRKSSLILNFRYFFLADKLKALKPCLDIFNYILPDFGNEVNYTLTDKAIEVV